MDAELVRNTERILTLADHSALKERNWAEHTTIYRAIALSHLADVARVQKRRMDAIDLYKESLVNFSALTHCTGDPQKWEDHRRRIHSERNLLALAPDSSSFVDGLLDDKENPLCVKNSSNGILSADLVSAFQCSVE